MAEAVKTVLFLCTGNSCRSIMAEAMLRHLGRGQFRALSAGSRPAGFVHPLAVQALKVMQIPLKDAESKSWDTFVQQPVDVVITLCDSAAAESCPVFPGGPYRAHWSLPDPAYFAGDPAQRNEFALLVAQRLRLKIEGLLTLDWERPSHEIQGQLDALGEI